MDRKSDNELLDEILTGTDLDSFRRKSLEQGLATLRQQQRRRRILRIAGPALAIALPLAVLTALDFAKEKQHRVASSEAANVLTGPKSIEKIGDADLLELFPGKTVALIGPPGHQRLLILE